ncbi:hypothetical protein B0H14DRAFT_2610303 [Mycena olivaceomarginata]|nr:hypothetical protein B0H14DRAFT_2610303 [Mycena olivaceomarginata]
MLQTQLDTYITRSRRSQEPLAVPGQNRADLTNILASFKLNFANGSHGTPTMTPSLSTHFCASFETPMFPPETAAPCLTLPPRISTKGWLTSIEFNCVAAENGADYQDRLTETVDRELTPGGTLRWTCRQSDFRYSEACEALAATAATARDVAGDAVAEATHAQLHLQLATNNRAIVAPIACRQAEAAYTVSLDRASTAQDAFTPPKFVDFFSELALNGCLMGANQLG